MTPSQCLVDRFAGRSEATFFDLSPLRTFRGAWLREDEIAGQGQECSHGQQGDPENPDALPPVLLKEVGGGHGLLG